MDESVFIEGVSHNSFVGFRVTFTVTRGPGLCLVSSTADGVSPVFEESFCGVVSSVVSESSSSVILIARLSSSLSFGISCGTIVSGKELISFGSIVWGGGECIVGGSGVGGLSGMLGAVDGASALDGVNCFFVVNVVFAIVVGVSCVGSPLC